MRGAAVGLVLFMGCTDSPSLDGKGQAVADPDPKFSISAANFVNPAGGDPTTIHTCGSSPDPACATLPSTQIRWGLPAYATDQSGLGFQNAQSAPSSIVYGATFDLGTLTHFNWPTVAGTHATGATLRLHLLVVPSLGGANIVDTDIDIPFIIDETSNYEDDITPCPYPSEPGNPCSDKVTFGTSTFALGSSTSTTVYDLQITGFVQPDPVTMDPVTVSELISNESKSTGATLQGFLREHCIDTDNDFVCDEFDNCVDTANNDQLDTDGDGHGDVCDVCPADNPDDPDGDGECGVPEPCPCDAPWANHGAYVSCMAHATTQAVRDGELTHQERGAIMAAAGANDCGK